MTRRFSLLVDDRPETLLRVTGLCLRRRADVVALHYGRSRHPGWARLDLELAVDTQPASPAGTSERQWATLVARLNALVEVRDVAELRAYTA